MMPRPALRSPLGSVLRRGLFCGVLFAALTMPFTALADCCRCVGTDVTKNVCLSISTGGCATIQQQANNTNISSMTCDTTALSSTQCAAKPSGICDTLADAASYNPNSTTASTGNGQALVVPTLNVQIPGLTFATEAQNVGGNIGVPFLAQYIAAVYKYLLGVSVIAAAVMIVYGGFKYILGSTALSVSSGKEIIQDALIGLFLVFASYTILYTITPNVQPTALSVGVIQPIEYKGMESTYGFFDNDSDSQQQNASQQSGLSSAGSAGAIDPTSGESLSGNAAAALAGVTETGTLASQRLASYCTAQGAAGQDYDAKIMTLVRAVLGFYKICYIEKSCVYVRGGSTDLRSGKVTAGAGDVPFYLSWFTQFHPSYDWSDSCRERWNEDYEDPDTGKEGPFSSFFYANRKKPDFADFEYSGSCGTELRNDYQEYLADPMTELGYFGGDCGTTPSAIYACAGGQIGRPFGGPPNLFYYINYDRVTNYSNPNQSPGTDFIVWKAKDLADMKNQAQKAGGLKFGDIFVIGSGGHQHNFMYTGGRADVPFEVFEMGGGAADGIPQVGTASARVTGLQAPVGGMRAMGPGGVTTDNPASIVFKYVDGFASKYKKGAAYPVTVARPYNFKACTTKTDCDTGQACHCTASDGGAWSTDKCNITGICHKAKSGTFCNTDEQCPNGTSCSGNFCK